VRARVAMTLMVTAGLMSGVVELVPTATAQSQDGPQELWDAYPLDERETDPLPTPAGVAPGPARAPATVEADEGAARWSVGVLLVGALVAFAVGALLPLLRRDHRVPLPAGAAPAGRREGARGVRNRRFAPDPARDGETSPTRTSSDSRRE
jgi:hypothetical protein